MTPMSRTKGRSKGGKRSVKKKVREAAIAQDEGSIRPILTHFQLAKKCSARYKNGLNL